jgi:hypothetical protein
VWLVLLLSACGERAREDTPCSTVAARFYTVAHAELTGHAMDAALRRGAEEQLSVLRDALARSCLRTGWSEAARDCMVRATDRVGVESCEQLLSDEQRAALDSWYTLETK